MYIIEITDSKKIYWNTNSVNKPTHNQFNFLMDNVPWYSIENVNFIDEMTIQAVLDRDNYTYARVKSEYDIKWKYYSLERTDKILKSGYVYMLKLDVFATYGYDFFINLTRSDYSFFINRCNLAGVYHNSYNSKIAVDELLPNPNKSHILELTSPDIKEFNYLGNTPLKGLHLTNIERIFSVKITNTKETILQYGKDNQTAPIFRNAYLVFNQNMPISVYGWIAHNAGAYGTIDLWFSNDVPMELYIEYSNRTNPTARVWRKLTNIKMSGVMRETLQNKQYYTNKNLGMYNLGLWTHWLKQVKHLFIYTERADGALQDGGEHPIMLSDFSMYNFGDYRQYDALSNIKHPLNYTAKGRYSNIVSQVSSDMNKYTASKLKQYNNDIPFLNGLSDEPFINGATDYLITKQTGLYVYNKDYILYGYDWMPDTDSEYITYLNVTSNSRNATIQAAKGNLGWNIANSFLGGASSFLNGFASMNDDRAGGIAQMASAGINTGLGMGRIGYDYSNQQKMRQAQLADKKISSSHSVMMTTNEIANKVNSLSSIPMKDVKNNELGIVLNGWDYDDTTTQAHINNILWDNGLKINALMGFKDIKNYEPKLNSWDTHEINDFVYWDITIDKDDLFYMLSPNILTLSQIQALKLVINQPIRFWKEQPNPKAVYYLDI